MRVLMLSWEYPPHIVGGMGKHVTELAPALASEGVELYLVTPQLRGGPAEETLDEGVHVLRVPVPPMEDYEFVSFVMQANREMELAAHALQEQMGGFDLIHAHDWLTSSAGANLKQTWRIPLVATIHATERGRGRGQLNNSHSERINHLEWWLTYEAWRVIICSQFMALEMCDYFHTPADKIDVVPNGVHLSPSPFANQREQLAFRRRFACDDQALVYYVGRVVYEKGPGVLLEAWPQLRAAHNARLVIAGAGGYLDTLKSRAWELDLVEQVIITGFISDSDRDRLYHVADLAVFPSLYESFGIVALEAMAAGCPVVVSDTGGLAEVVQSHHNGIAVQPDSPASLAWGILHTLQHPRWARARAENALREVRERYDWHAIARETIAIYRRVQGEWHASSWGKELVPLDGHQG
jgi:glycosyltransferase involved in cell wall biosynthesis